MMSFLLFTYLLMVSSKYTLWICISSLMLRSNSEIFSLTLFCLLFFFSP